MNNLINQSSYFRNNVLKIRKFPLRIKKQINKYLKD